MPGLALAKPDEQMLLKKAYLSAGKALGLSQAARGGIEPAAKAGELALLFIRCYRGLFVLTGGRSEDMRHWMHTANRDTGGIPAEQVRSVQGLARVVEYLDAMRGKV
jgi:hypothetical protein